MQVLTVIHAFGDYPRGHKITDPTEIARVLEGENARSVVKTEEPAPQE
jgi:hypothetical protein